MYDTNSNIILAKPIKNKPQGEILRAQAYLYNYLIYRGFKQQLQILDTDCPAAL